MTSRSRQGLQVLTGMQKYNKQGCHSSTDKKIQDFPGPPWKIFQDLFGAIECLNIKKKWHLLTIFRV